MLVIEVFAEEAATDPRYLRDQLGPGASLQYPLIRTKPFAILRCLSQCHRRHMLIEVNLVVVAILARHSKQGGSKSAQSCSRSGVIILALLNRMQDRIKIRFATELNFTCD